jgi:hypothetical protein
MVTTQQATMMATARRVMTTTDKNDGDGDGERLKKSIGREEYRITRGLMNRKRQKFSIVLGS